MTDHMREWWQETCRNAGFTPTVVQGGFMERLPGGGAAASAGVHDKGGCIDFRTWDLTEPQIDIMVREGRKLGGAVWRRDKSAKHGGMDPHCHVTLGSDQPLSSGAKASWASYLAGKNGLSNNQPDYEWRPNPLVLAPPEDDMFSDADRKTLNQIHKGLGTFRKRELDRDVKLKKFLKEQFNLAQEDLDKIFEEVDT